MSRRYHCLGRIVSRVDEAARRRPASVPYLSNDIYDSFVQFLANSALNKADIFWDIIHDGFLLGFCSSIIDGPRGTLYIVHI